MTSSQGNTRKEAEQRSPSTVTYSQSGGLVRRLAMLECSIAVSSYQSGLH
jgi:hypothetical protein